MFKYDPGAFREQLERDGYVHLKDVLADDFVAGLRAFHDTALRDADAESRDWRIRGKKSQFVFDFPSVAAAEIFRDGMARLTGIGPQDFTISERHLKVYDEAADPWPAPHKDRNASHFSIGLPVVLPEGSSVCVFPDLEPGPNTEERAVFLSPPPGGTARDIYRSARAEILNERLGDMVVFLGSALFHERVNGAGTSVLYIKVNGRGEDPLGENIYAGNPAYAHA